MVLNVPVSDAAGAAQLQFKYAPVFVGFPVLIVFSFLIGNASEKGKLLLLST